MSELEYRTFYVAPKEGTYIDIGMVENQKISNKTFILYCTLCYLAQHEKHLNVSDQAKYCGMDINTFKKHRKPLIDMEIIHGERTGKHYHWFIGNTQVSGKELMKDYISKHRELVYNQTRIITTVPEKED